MSNIVLKATQSSDPSMLGEGYTFETLPPQLLTVLSGEQNRGVTQHSSLCGNLHACIPCSQSIALLQAEQQAFKVRHIFTAHAQQALSPSSRWAEEMEKSLSA